MIGLTLRIQEQTENRLFLSLPLRFRVLFFIIAGFICLGLIISGQFHPTPMVIILISVASALYNESWRFDGKLETVEHRFGLVFLFKRTVIALDTIQAVTISRFVKGRIAVPKPGEETGISKVGRFSLQKGLLTLSLELNDGRATVIETVPERAGKELERKGSTIARFCAVPFRPQ